GARNLISGNGSDGVVIDGGATLFNVVGGNYIGTDGTGAIALGSPGSGVVGLGAPRNTIGGSGAGMGNLISGQSASRRGVDGGGASGNVVQGNLIGTNAAGTASLGNQGDGVLLLDGASNNQIGGTTSGARNVISGNGGRGVAIGFPGTQNKVQGNYIGTDVT